MCLFVNIIKQMFLMKNIILFQFVVSWLKKCHLIMIYVIVYLIIGFVLKELYVSENRYFQVLFNLHITYPVSFNIIFNYWLIYIPSCVKKLFKLIYILL